MRIVVYFELIFQVADALLATASFIGYRDGIRCIIANHANKINSRQLTESFVPVFENWKELQGSFD
jgi:hypothetical protein